MENELFLSFEKAIIELEVVLRSSNHIMWESEKKKMQIKLKEKC